MKKCVWMAVAALALAGIPSGLVRAEAMEGSDVPCGSLTPQESAALAAVKEAAAREAEALLAAENGTVADPEWRKKGLVLRYTFGKGGVWGPGTVVKDLSGGGHDGKVHGDGLEVVRGIGKRGKAVRFDGKGDYIRVPRDEALEPDEITVAAWVKVREGFATCGGDGIGAVVFKRNTGFHDNEDYCLEIHPWRLLRTDLSSPRGGHVKVTTREGLEPELWHHVAVAVGGGMARIYVDGELAVEQAHAHPFDHSRTADLFVGARDHAGHPMDRFGAFDLYELKIWDEALGAKRVAALYRERAGHFGVAKREAKEKKGLVLHYAFGKGGEWGPGSVVKDSSGGAHDGRVEGDGLEAVRGIGRGSRAVRFDGKGDFIRVPRDKAFEGQEMSVAAWVKVREGAAWENGATIAFKRNAELSHNEGFHLEIFPDRTVRAVASGPNAAQCRVQSTVPMEDNEWHLVAMSHAPGDTRLYIDGGLAGRGDQPQVVVHNPEADLLIGGRDHALYPVDLFAKFDVAEVTVWNRALGDEEMAGLYREKEGWPGVGRSGSAGTALVESGAERKLSWRGIEQPPRKFPAWEPGTGKDSGTQAAWVRELRELVAQGRRDRAASPEFLGALEGVLERWGGKGGMYAAPPDRRGAMDKLPMKEEWRGWGWPEGWEAVRRDVWKFEDGAARQVESKANTRYVLFYEPGMEWKDYEMTFRFESDKWFQPPANSAAAVYFRYKSVEEAYSIAFDGFGQIWVNSHEKGKREGRTLAWIPMARETILDGKPWTVKVKGNKIELWHEGKRVVYVTDTAHEAGTVGVESIHIPMKFGGLEVR